MAEGNDDYVKHEVTDGYRAHFKRDWKVKQGHALRYPFAKYPRSPFGRHLDHEWNFDPAQKRMMKEVGVQPLDIEGPPNWNQIWPQWAAIGRDYGRKYGSPQLEQLAEHQTNYTNINVIRKIQEGSFGLVCEITATNRANQREERLACKMIPLHYRGFPLQLSIDLMLADLNAIKFIKHKNIVECKDIVSIPDSQTGFPYAFVYLLMELCDGDLMDLLEKIDPSKGLPEKYCMHWFKQIASAVRKLHSDNIAHLDIKPENMLFSYRGGPPPQPIQLEHIFNMVFKLTDFGMAVIFQESDGPDYTIELQSGLYRGTPDYMSPEAIGLKAGQKIQAKPCDIFSLGYSLAYVLMDPGVFQPHRYTQNSGYFRQSYIEGTGFYSMISKKMAEMLSHMTNPDPKLRPTIDELFRIFHLED